MKHTKFHLSLTENLLWFKGDTLASALWQ